MHHPKPGVCGAAQLFLGLVGGHKQLAQDTGYEQGTAAGERCGTVISALQHPDLPNSSDSTEHAASQLKKKGGWARLAFPSQ